MGSSARKKKDKKKDFQKPKLRVGKTKAKPDNFTDTSFKSKSVVINQQSLTTSEPSSFSQFSHYLSLASSSKSETQRKDALSYLVTQLSSKPVSEPLPLPTTVILPKLLPLILDGSSPVRTQLIKFFRLLPSADLKYRAEAVLLYTRAGMTHLATQIRDDALTMLEWLLDVAKEDAVTCPGGWVKTLKSFMATMGWAISKDSSKWSSGPKASSGKDGKAFSRQVLALSKFLKAGLENKSVEIVQVRQKNWPFLSGSDIESMRIPTRPNAFAHLNLFGAPRDEEGEMYHDRESRQRVFKKLFQPAVESGIENSIKFGGEAGRAASVLKKVVDQGMKDYSGVDEDLYGI